MTLPEIQHDWRVDLAALLGVGGVVVAIAVGALLLSRIPFDFRLCVVDARQADRCLPFADVLGIARATKGGDHG